MTSFLVPCSSSPGSRGSRLKGSSMAMSALLGQFDRLLGAVEHGQARVVLRLMRHGAVAEDLPVALVVVTEQAGGEVVTAAMPLTELGIDSQFHCAAPVGLGVAVAGARPAITRVSSAAHSSSVTAWRSGVTSALPIASSRQKWAIAPGDSDGSSSPLAWAARTRSASPAPRSPT